jgi:hypothetical protein
MKLQEVKNRLLGGVLFDADLALKSILARDLRETTLISDIYDESE